jgi:hypothetical protein
MLELAAPEDQEPFDAFAAETADQAFEVAFAFGACTGVRMMLKPSLAKMASKAGGNFLSRSWIRNRACRSRSSRSISRFGGCWRGGERKARRPSSRSSTSAATPRELSSRTRQGWQSVAFRGAKVGPLSAESRVRPQPQQDGRGLLSLSDSNVHDHVAVE